MIAFGLPWNPWIPWNPWNSMDSMEFYGFHGIPWIPCPLLHGMDHELWSMVDFPWSMVHGPFWLSFSRKNRPEHCFLQYIGALWELIPGFTGSSGFTGNGVMNHRSDPPFHGQEFSDDGSSQQTPSN